MRIRFAVRINENQYAKWVQPNPSERIALERDAALQTEIAAARPYGERELARGLAPALRPTVPDAEVVARESDRDGLALAGLEKHVLEPAEHARGLARAGREVQVELRDLQLRIILQYRANTDK